MRIWVAGNSIWQLDYRAHTSWSEVNNKPPTSRNPRKPKQQTSNMQQDNSKQNHRHYLNKTVTSQNPTTRKAIVHNRSEFLYIFLPGPPLSVLFLYCTHKHEWLNRWILPYAMWGGGMMARWKAIAGEKVSGIVILWPFDSHLKAENCPKNMTVGGLSVKCDRYRELV